jgi:glycine dehydrogenase
MSDSFAKRHIGPREHEMPEMLSTVGVKSIDELINQTIPSSIRLKKELNLPKAISEQEYLEHIHRLAKKNKLYRSFIGLGYYPTASPSVVMRNVFENPGWYTSYTPYQAEISQGRLEALLNFQTMITELTEMEIANSSLLDESTAAGEAMSMMLGARSRQAVKNGSNVLFVDENIFPQNLEVVKLRSEPIGVEVVVGDYRQYEFTGKEFGCIVQYPAADGTIRDYKSFADKAHENDALITAIVDIMSMVLLKSPASWGADIAVGSTQRFGVPMGLGGPHAAFLATYEKYKRSIPGRIIGVSVDRFGNPALRMALQTREQHIKRERATSNICTAQALLATMAGMYAVYHGPEGLKKIAVKIHESAVGLAEGLKSLGYKIINDDYFDTISIELPENVSGKAVCDIALKNEVNLYCKSEKQLQISTDELTTQDDLNKLLSIFAEAIGKNKYSFDFTTEIKIDKKFIRSDNFMQQKVFNSFHSETEMMRYIKKLERRDIALNHSMIPLGSCTMKLNPATSMLPLSWAEFNSIHPFAPVDQWQGYKEMMQELVEYLKEITGFADISLQPNSGAAGEHTGLMVIRAYHHANGDANRDICLIPSSAHGTNPASAVMAGMQVVVVACDENGNIDVDDLRNKAEEHSENLAAIMITYPSTHGVFESKILEIIEIIHQHGGQVYMDGANMNAQVGLTHPGIIGADVCHLNLHKTFAIPHGGGGPGVGPIGVAKHLVDYLPGHPVISTGGKDAIRPVAAAPFGSPLVLPITYAYIRMLGTEGLKKSTEMAILNANYLAAVVKGFYEVLYTGETGRCAHEMILDCHSFREEYGVEASDIARRLMDYGFHAPTLSFPVHETLMVEPTESESKQELDRFAHAMIEIKKELEAIKNGELDKEDNPLKNAPHTQFECTGDNWEHKYSRQQAAFPLDYIKENKFWPYVAKIDNGYGDRNLVCTCEPLDSYM